MEFWLTNKPYIHQVKKEYREGLLDQIHCLDFQHKCNGSEVPLQQLNDSTNQLKLLGAQDIAKQIMYSKQTIFEYRVKLGKLLARNLGEHKDFSQLSNMKDHTLNQQISWKYFICIIVSYMLLWIPNMKMGVSFLDKYRHLRIMEEHSAQLDAPITVDKIEATINYLHVGKSSGSDGFPVEFYKKFKMELLLYMMQIYTHCLQVKQVSKFCLEAKIVLIAKADKYPSRPESYRPISLLNID